MMERLVLVCKLNEATVGEFAGEKEFVSNKQDIEMGRKDVLDIQVTDKLGDGMTHSGIWTNFICKI